MLFDSPAFAAGLYPYLEALTGDTEGVLAEMEAYGRRRRFPVVGPLVGRLLQQLTVISGASRVLELGSGFGYSAAWFLLAAPDVAVTCTDSSTLNCHRALEFLGRLGVADRVDFLVGDCLELAQALEGTFDIVFCDIDKDRYPDAFAVSIPMLRPRGLFVADNALWRGYAWEDVPDDAPAFRSASMPGVRELNRLVHRTEGVLGSIVPLRDGLALAVRR